MAQNAIEQSAAVPVVADYSNEKRVPWKQGRIFGRSNGDLAPLIGWVAPVGRPSPSSSLLVERFDFLQQDWQTLMHVDQVVALYLKSTTVLHRPESGRAESQMHLGPDHVSICERDQSESLFWKEAVSLLCVRIPDSSLDEAARFILGRERVELRATGRAVDPALTSLLHAVEAERRLGFPAGPLFLNGIENAVASILVTSHSNGASTPMPKTGGLAPHRFRRVLEFMQMNMDRQFTLDELARCAGLSVSHFSHQFRRSTNLSPHRYVLRARIEHSKSLLRNRKLSILDVALAVGFDNQQHYATVFRRIAGVSPSRYRQDA